MNCQILQPFASCSFFLFWKLSNARTYLTLPKLLTFGIGLINVINSSFVSLCISLGCILQNWETSSYGTMKRKE